MEIYKFLIDHWEPITTILLLPAFSYIYKKNSDYKRLVDNFKKKLPPKPKRARELSRDEKMENLFLRGTTARYVTVLDLNTHQVTVPSNEIDKFFNELDDFNYSLVIFHKHYKGITQNLKSFQFAKAENKNLDLVMIQEVLDSAKLGFWEILWFKLALKGRFIKFKYWLRKKYGKR